MTDFIKFFTKEMGKGLIELTCAGIVNILKYAPGVQGVDERPYSLALIPDELKWQKMCEKAVEEDPGRMYAVPDRFKTKKMCEKAVEDDARSLAYVSDRFKTQKMFIKALKVDPWQLHDIPDYFKTQKMCDKTVKDDPYTLQFVPDWFVTQQQLKVGHDDDDYCNDDELIEWYNGYQKRKAQKTQIKEELMPIAWHPSRWWGWCVPNHEKQEIKKLQA